MKSRSLEVLSFYYLLYFGVVAAALAFDRDYFARNSTASFLIAGFVFVVPFLGMLLIKLQPSFAKWLRVSFYHYFRVKTFAVLSLVILACFGAAFVYNYLSIGVSGEQAFLNVFFVDLILLFFISLVLTGRFQIKDPKGLLIKQEGDDKVYLYRNGVLQHIPDPPTLTLLGYSFRDIQVISPKEFQKFTVRPPLESVATGRLIQADGRPEVYIVIGGEKHHVPEPQTLIVMQQLNAQANHQRIVETVSEADLNNYPTGDPLKSVLE